MRVEPIPTSEAKPWIQKRHYAHRMPCVQYAFGLFDDCKCVGVVTYGLPASPHLCRGICGPDFADKVIELNRLCIGTVKKNAASILVGRSLRLLPKPRIIVSYADTGQGHVGYIYQATNWIYTGLTDAGRKTPRGDRIIVENRHGRHQARIEGSGRIDKSAGRWIRRKPKYRYIFFLGDDRERSEMLSVMRYPILAYPKGPTIRYDATAKIDTQQVFFRA